LRYSYLPGAAPAVLIGAAVAAAVDAWRAAQLRAAVLAAVCLGTALGLGGWALLARREVAVWRNSETLWTAAIAVDPDCALCHHQLGIYLLWTRRPDDAEAELRRALAIRPTYALAARNLASVLRERGIARHEAGNYEAAVRLFAEAASLVPGEPELLDRLARAQAALAARTAGGKPPG
jgi:tetratricopeptide (TPR) repeat protein